MKSLAFFKRETVPSVSVLRSEPEKIFLQDTRKDFALWKVILENGTDTVNPSLPKKVNGTWVSSCFNRKDFLKFLISLHSLSKALWSQRILISKAYLLYVYNLIACTWKSSSFIPVFCGLLSFIKCCMASGGPDFHKTVMSMRLVAISAVLLSLLH